MRITRRGLLRTGAVAGVGAGVAGSAVPAADALTPAARRTTMKRTLLKGSGGGYQRLLRGPGERHVLRLDLGARPRPGRRRRRRGLLAFVQLSDVHVLDAQSPLRVEFTDRQDDEPEASSGIFTSAYRPHEMLTAQIADAMVRRINRIRRGPVTGKRLALAIQTGDNSDNSQLNETRWNIDVLDGGPVRPDSGDLTTYEGVADGDPTYYDTHYWHPHGTPPGKTDDIPRRVRGFPTVPGLLDAARRPFRAAGLAMPWYTALGNHDGLVQGNFPIRTLQLNAVAVGELKMISPPAGMSTADLIAAMSTGNLPALLQALDGTPSVRRVTADPQRRLLDRAQLVAEHFTTTGAPRGHGFTARNRTDGTAYYSFDKGRVRFVALDTVNPNGYANGSLDSTQFAWLGDQLERSADRIVIVFSHHTSQTMDNPLVGTGQDPESRVLGDEVLTLLLEHRCVVAWVNGHSHQNRVWPRPRPGGGGLWEINTAAHIDWPLQSRIIEVADNRDGTLSLFSTVVDHAGTRRWSGRLDTSRQLASLARELAANDWHHPGDGPRGEREDRNVELVVRNPLS
ncbi:TIGR03767 family metallophosphoesterase [Nocardioides dilutus]